MVLNGYHHFINVVFYFRKVQFCLLSCFVKYVKTTFKAECGSWLLREKKKTVFCQSTVAGEPGSQWSQWARRAGQGGVMSSEHRAEQQAWPLPGAARAVWTGDGWWPGPGPVLVTSYTLPGVKWLWWEVKWGDILQSAAQSLCRENVFCAMFCFVFFFNVDIS